MDYLTLTDAELIAQCEVDTYRASGPGGQKRNKTSSAVRLRHAPTGVIAHATESRSQHENKARALRRLREKLALELRAPVDLDRFCCSGELAALFHAPPGKKSVEFLRGARALLDLFDATGCSVRDTAARVGVTTGQLSRVLTGDERLLRAANALRTARGLHALR